MIDSLDDPPAAEDASPGIAVALYRPLPIPVVSVVLEFIPTGVSLLMHSASIADSLIPSSTPWQWTFSVSSTWTAVRWEASTPWHSPLLPYPLSAVLLVDRRHRQDYGGCWR